MDTLSSFVDVEVKSFNRRTSTEEMLILVEFFNADCAMFLSSSVKIRNRRTRTKSVLTIFVVILRARAREDGEDFESQSTRDGPC